MTEFLVLTSIVESREKSAPFREAHFNYMASLKKDGKLVIAGRFADGMGGGYILKANSADEAKALADHDPYHSSGARSYTIREWETRF
ncbi:MAG TPA: YciI family protein [Nitrososphaerales archaeon]|nr:YciI family protein [Nitrososphaerales archaeon]